MAKKATFKVKHRRRREGITDYKSRLALLKSGKKRLVVRVGNKKIVTQIIEYDPKGDRTVVNCTSLELRHYGWKGHLGNVSSAYLTGLLCAVKAKEKGIKEAVLDIGLHTPVHGSNVFAVLKGALEGGLNIPHDKEALPKDERVLGKNIEVYRKISLNFAEVKDKILNRKPDVKVWRSK